MKTGLGPIDGIAAGTGLLRLAARRARRGLTILMYHRVLPAAEAGSYLLPNLVVTRECFERQVQWLAARTRVVTVREGVEALASGTQGRGSKPMVALTFDDGYSDNALHAAPILEKAGVRGTFFVTTSFIKGTPLWFDRAPWYFKCRGNGTAPTGPSPAGNGWEREIQPHLRSMDAWLGWLKTMDTARREQVLAAIGAIDVAPGCTSMTIQQLAAMAQVGHEIAAHTVTHPILIQEPPEQLRRELVDAKSELEAWTGKPVTGFCYPNGMWSTAVRRACVDAGYSYATTTHRHVNLPGEDPMTLGRRWIAPDSTTKSGAHSGASFAAEVWGLHDLIRDRMGRPRGPAGTPTRPMAGEAGVSEAALPSPTA